MTELIQLALNDFNLPITILLGCMALFWIISALGAIDIESIDTALGLETDLDLEVDLDVDVDLDHELDLDLDAEASAQSSSGGLSGALHSVLRFLGAADAPIMFTLTLYVLWLWALNIGGNYYANPNDLSPVATGILCGAVVVAFILTRLTIKPLKPLLKLYSGKEKQIPVLGRSGSVRSVVISETETGQVEAEGGLLLTARAATGTGELSKGDEIVVIAKEDGPRDVYVVRAV